MLVPDTPPITVLVGTVLGTTRRARPRTMLLLWHVGDAHERC